MYTQKAFAKIQSLVDNSLGAIATVGELSPLGWSFAREKTHFASSDYPAVGLSVFSSKRITGTGNNAVAEYVEPDQLLVSRIIEIVNWVHIDAQAGRFGQNSDNFRTSFLNVWGERCELNGSGKMVGVNNAWYPTWIDFNLKGLEEESRFKIWFSDGAFVNEYDEYEIVVVPPVAQIDDLIKGFVETTTLKSKITMTEIVQRLNLAREDYPETAVRTDSFDWVNPLNRSQRIPFDWTTIIWGMAGDNIDNRKEAIRDYIDANSSIPRSEWEKYFPELYTSTEFIIVPMFKNFSIPNRRLETGLYSPVITIHDIVEVSKLAVRGERYTPEHVERHVTTVPSLFKQLSLAVTPGPNNREGTKRFVDVFPDYINQRSTDTDYGRMGAVTREFVDLLNTMLRHAEELTDISTVPRGFNRTVREGLVYLSQSYMNVQYLVLSKHSINDPETGIPAVLVDGDGYILSADDEPLVGA